MRFRACLAVAVAALLSGCGGSTRSVTAHSASEASTEGSGTVITHPPAKPATYELNLLGTNPPVGARNASAHAVISLNPERREICWKFSELKNVQAPTTARFYTYVPLGTGIHGIPLGHAYTPEGCLGGRRPFLFDAIEAHPEIYYVALYSHRFPGGVVRGPL